MMHIKVAIKREGKNYVGKREREREGKNRWDVPIPRTKKKHKRGIFLSSESIIHSPAEPHPKIMPLK